MPNVQVGNDVVFFPDSMTNEEIESAIIQATIAEMPKGAPMQATMEPALSLMGGIAGQVAGGLSGLARGGYGLATGESGQEAAKQAAEASESVAGSIQAMTRPRTQYGARGAQALGEVFEPVAEGIQQASQYLGDVAFEKSGGSPLAGAAGYTTPEAILTILPATLLRRMVPSGNFLDRSGNPTPELLGALRQMGLSWDDLSAAAMREIPESPGRSLVTGTPMIERSLDPARAAQIRSGGSEGALAPLAAAGNRTIPDPMAQEAIKQWDDRGLVQAVKTATPQTREAMLEMLDLRSRITENKRLAQTQRPTDIVGQSATTRVLYLRDLANEARRDLNNIAETQLAGKPMETQPILTAVTDALEQLDVGLVRGEDGLPKPVFEGSMISQNKSSQRVINSLFNLLKEGGAPDALRFHKLKRQLDELIDYRKSMQGGLTDSGRNVLKGVRRALNDSLRSVNDDYARVNDILSDVLTVFDDLDSVSGKRTNIFEADASQKLGQEFRKLFSNYGVRTDMVNALESLDKTATQYGANFKDSVMDLAMFANALDNRFGPVAETSFRGEIAAASQRTQAEEAMRRAAEQGLTRTVMDKVMGAYQSARGVSDDAAYASMEQLLKRNQ